MSDFRENKSEERADEKGEQRTISWQALYCFSGRWNKNSE
jgi:hypothetical protein